MSHLADSPRCRPVVLASLMMVPPFVLKYPGLDKDPAPTPPCHPKMPRAFPAGPLGPVFSTISPPDPSGPRKPEHSHLE